MSPLDGDLLRLLSHMPLLDRMEMAALSGWSGGGVYRAVSRLEDAGLIASVPHGTELIPPTRRFHLTAAGLRRLARAENAAPESGTGQALEGLLRDLPVSTRWRRALLERLDAVAVVYRIAAAISNTAFPVRFQWYRAMPMDAAVTLPGGGTIAIVRQGPTTDRTGFSKRLWRLTQGPQPGCILVLAPRRGSAAPLPQTALSDPPPRRSSPWSGRRPQRPPTPPCGGCAPSAPPSACGPPSTAWTAGARCPPSGP